jgi:hypothetical protein
MKSHKYRRNYNTFFYKHGFDPGRYYREGYKYHEILPSGFYDSQTWGALKKCWVGYVIALRKGEFDNEIKYASRIQNLEKELGLEVTDFKCLEGVSEDDIKLIESNKLKNIHG